MSDILQHIDNPDKNDPDAKLSTLNDWSENIARQLAAEESIELNENHLKIALKLRTHYKSEVSWNNPRKILSLMETDLLEIDPGSKNNERKTLYALFPQGPVRQGCKIAGLPVPANSSNPSFGSVH